MWNFSTGFNREYADLHYVKFPIAQGSQSFPLNLNVTGITTLGETQLQTRNTVQNQPHYLNFSDSSSTGIGYIQKSANLSVNPSTGVLSVGGLTMSGASNITLGDGTIAPTLGQIGYVYSTTTAIALTTTFQTVLSIASVPVGTYIMSYRISLGLGGTVNTTLQALPYFNGANFGGLLFTYYPSSNYFTQTYTLTIRVSTAGVVEVRGQVIGAGTTLPIENAILQLTRIA